MRAGNFAGIFLFVLMACNNGNGTRQEACPQDSIREIACVENADGDERELFKDGYVCASEDGRIIIESGIYPEFGTSPDYWTRWTITDHTGKTHIIENLETPYMHDIHAITKKDGSVYYIVSCFGKASSTDTYEWLRAYRIVGDTLQNVNVADGGTQIGSNGFDVNYNLSDLPRLTEKAGSGVNDWMLEYDGKAKELSIHVSLEDRRFIDRYDIWRFDGNRFVYVGNRANKRLHRSLADYNALIAYATTEDYILRIDSLDGGVLRYASWKKPKTMADKPDRIIKGGKRLKYGITPDGICPKDGFRFFNGDREYIVNHYEVKGSHNAPCQLYEYLLVRKRNGTVLIKQEQKW